MRAGSLGNAPVARSLERLVAGDGRACKRLVGLLLEDLAKPFQRGAGLAPEPRARAEALPEAVRPGAGHSPRRHGQLGLSVVVDEFPLGEARRPAQATDTRALDDPPRAVDLDDLVLGALREHRRVEHERGAGSNADRVDAG